MNMDHEYGVIAAGAGSAPPLAAPRRKGRLRSLLAKILAPLIVIASKAKAILLIAAKAKFVVLIGSMLLSVAAYGWAFGWAFAVGFVLLLLCHEMGHVIQLRREGIKASSPIFIPFLGALVKANILEKDAAAEARSAIAGPILGSLAAVVPLVVWLVTGSEFWRSLAYVGFLINLFNLLPVLPLDGGRIMAALSPVIWIIGVVVGLIACVVLGDWTLIILLVILGGPELWHRFRSHRKGSEGKAYYAVALRTRIALGSAYLGLAGLLILGVVETYVPRAF